MQHMNLPPQFAGGLVIWRLRILHRVAQVLGLLVHVEGFPYGTRRNLGQRDRQCGGIDRVANPFWQNAVDAPSAGQNSYQGLTGRSQHSSPRPENAL